MFRKKKLKYIIDFSYTEEHYGFTVYNIQNLTKNISDTS